MKRLPACWLQAGALACVCVLAGCGNWIEDSTIAGGKTVASYSTMPNRYISSAQADIPPDAHHVAAPYSVLHFTAAQRMHIADGTLQPPDELLGMDVPEDGGIGVWENTALPDRHPAGADAGHAGMTGANHVHWYRWLVVAPGTDMDWQLYVPRWNVRGHVAVYANGNLLWRTHGNTQWNAFNAPLWLALPRGQALRSGPMYVHMRISGETAGGSALSSVWMGETSALHNAWRLRSFLQYGILDVTVASYLFMGVSSLFLWLFSTRREYDRLYLRFSLLALLAPAPFLPYLITEALPLLGDPWITCLSYGGYLVLLPVLMVFLGELWQWAQPRLLRLLGWYGLGACPVLVLWVVLRHQQQTAHALANAVQWLTLPASLIYLAMVARAARHAPNPVARVYALMTALVAVGAINDFALLNHRSPPSHLLITPYSMVFALLLYLFAVMRRYQGALNVAEHAQDNLQKALTAKEAELATSHEHLMRIRQEQVLSSERSRMMQDMHDGIGAALISALRAVERGEPSQELTTGVLKECLDDLKLAVDSLEFAEHEIPALLGILRFRLGPRLQAAGLHLQWQIDDLPPLAWLDPPLALDILRILQEVISNLLKHGNATQLRITACCQSRQGQPGVAIGLHDNSRPFDPSAVQAPGKGLSNIRQRCKRLGGIAGWQAYPPKPQTVEAGPGLHGDTASGNSFVLWLPVERNRPSS